MERNFMELMTSKEVQEHLGIKANHLYQLQYRKILVWVKREGKKVFYNREDVEAVKAAREGK